MLKNQLTCAIILAGGLGKRFGSYKPLFLINGRPLLEYLVRGIRDLYQEIVVIAGTEWQRKEISERLNQLTILIDRIPSKGPIGGIMTGAMFAHTEYCQIIPVDSPLPNPQVLRQLDARAHGFDGAVPAWPDGRIEPLHGVYRAELAAKEAERLIRRGEHSVVSLVRALPNVRYVSIDELRQLDPDLETFANVNTRDDLESMIKKLKLAS